MARECCGALQSSQPPPAEALLTSLLNEITTLPDRFVLVLDDYHLIDAKPIDQALTFLLEHLPPQMHLVIATREDPQLPLARLRARGQLTELRAADLRFTPAEAAAFLNQVMGLSLSADDIAALEDRTEGWIAGLQLAALSLQGHQDVPGSSGHSPETTATSWTIWSTRSCSGSPKLSAASYSRPPFSTGCMARCAMPSPARREAPRGWRPWSAATSLSCRWMTQRHWYRYHHLFADVLSAHLLAEQPDQVRRCIGARARGTSGHGSTADAIRHALAAGDFERAADLVELAIPAMRRSRQEATVLAGSRRSPTNWSAAGPCSASGMPGRY